MPHPLPCGMTTTPRSLSPARGCHRLQSCCWGHEVGAPGPKPGAGGAAVQQELLLLQQHGARRGLKGTRGQWGTLGSPGSTAAASPKTRLECSKAAPLSRSLPFQGHHNLTVTETHFAPGDSSLVLISSPGPFPGSGLCWGVGRSRGMPGRTCGPSEPPARAALPPASSSPHPETPGDGSVLEKAPFKMFIIKWRPWHLAERPRRAQRRAHRTSAVLAAINICSRLPFSQARFYPERNHSLSSILPGCLPLVLPGVKSSSVSKTNGVAIAGITN